MYPELKSPTHIVIHCSASRWGNATEIEKWHKANGWSRIGYHFIILNGHQKTSRIKSYDPSLDGFTENSLDTRYQGIHCPSMNNKAIAICLIGVNHFSMAQFNSLFNLVISLMQEYSISFSNVIGHYETSEQQNRWPIGSITYYDLQETLTYGTKPIGSKIRKTCPGFDMSYFRFLLGMRLNHGGS